MEMERRASLDSLKFVKQLDKRMIFKEETRTQPISKEQVWASWKRIKQGGKGMGIDQISIAMIESNPRKYLYPLWNRLSSGSYFPPPVRECEIPKGDGKTRKLGIPTVLDRVAQDVIKQELEKIAELKFHPSSFGYRPNKSAHQALEQCSKYCWERWYVVDVDIKGFFDNIDHGLMLEMLRGLTGEKHILLYCERWLKAPMQTPDGSIIQRTKGSPQGGVISPLLANIYLNEVFDKWISETQPRIVFERYADDIVIHTRSIEQSEFILDKLKMRLRANKLEVSESKTKIVYCYRTARQFKESKNMPVSFDFLGYTFKPRICEKSNGEKFWGYRPAISKKGQNKILKECRRLAFQNWTRIDIYKLSQFLAPRIRGWLYYYGKFRLSEMQFVFMKINRRIAVWFKRRYKLNTICQAYSKLKRIIRTFPNMFEHWKYGFVG
jgi:group II intron reverse transcriptase/maturase